MRFRESRTARNLLISFSAEAQARTRYNFFAGRAREEGFIQIARSFDEIAEQEFEHALRFFKCFNGGEFETPAVPAGVLENTQANLLSSAELERYTHGTMYKGFAEVAREEGFERAAEILDAISVAERHHEEIFRELAGNMASGRIFARSEERIWKCLGCGYLHRRPDKCRPVKPQGYFALLQAGARRSGCRVSLRQFLQAPAGPGCGRYRRNAPGSWHRSGPSPPGRRNRRTGCRGRFF
jgi:rubrerythrin